MWWDGMFSLLGDLLDPKGGRKLDWLSIVVIVTILVVCIVGYRRFILF